MQQRHSWLTHRAFRRSLGIWVLAALTVTGLSGGGEVDEGADLRIVAEQAPAGGLAVVVIELTEPKPITTGELCLRYPLGPVLGSLDNIALLNTGPVSGSAQVVGGEVEVTFNSPDASFGNSADLPIMVLAIPVSAQASPGQSAAIEIDLSRTTLRDPQGKPYTVTVKENGFSVGGVSITSLEPLSGTLAAGDFITVRGVGFQPDVRVDFQEADHDDAEFISSTEARVRLNSSFTLQPTTRVRVRNEDDSEDLFYPAALLQGVGDNSPPVANDDEAQAVAGVAIEIEVLDNDSDPDGDPLQLVAVGSPANGQALIIGERIRYTPDAAFSGLDAFTYQIADDKGAGAAAQVRVQVEPPQPQPVLSIGRSLLRLAVGQSAEVEVDVAQGPPGQAVTLRSQNGPLLQVTPPQLLGASSQRLIFRVLALQAGQSQLLAELGQAVDSIALEIVEGSALTIPVLRNDSDSRLGLALVNGSGQESQVRIRAFASPTAGTAAAADEPVPLFLQTLFTLQPGQQSARFIDEIEAGLQGFSGWLEISSLTPELHATFLNLPAERVTYAGDSGAIPLSSTAFITGSSFSVEAPPEFSILHRGLAPLVVAIDWVGPDGLVVGQVEKTLAGQEPLNASFAKLFPEAGQEGLAGYLRIQAAQPVVVYQQSLAPDFVFGQGAARPIPPAADASLVSALSPAGRGRLCLPHLVEGSGFFTEITLINGSATAAQGQVTFLAASDSDPLSGLTVPLDFEGNAQRVLRVGDLLGLDPDALVSGSLILEMPVGSAASAILGRLDDPGYRTAVPLAPEALREAVFAQVAIGELGLTRLFTGLAVVDLRSPQHPDNLDAEITIEVRTASGELAGEAVRRLPAGARSALLLTEWVEGLPDQQGGHIRVSSDAPVAFLELFGDFRQSFLSAVSASPVSLAEKPR